MRQTALKDFRAGSVIDGQGRADLIAERFEQLQIRSRYGTRLPGEKVSEGIASDGPVPVAKIASRVSKQSQIRISSVEREIGAIGG